MRPITGNTSTPCGASALVHVGFGADEDVGGAQRKTTNEAYKLLKRMDVTTIKVGSSAMIAIQIARILADFVLFLDLTDDETLNPDTAVQMMEMLSYHFDQMDKIFLRELVDAFGVIAAEYSGQAQELVRDIPHSFYLEETLAADDPVRLAELDAIRDARG